MLEDNYAIVGDGKDNNPINKIYKDEWIAFLEVRQDGQYNMYSPQARAITGLDKRTYIAIMSNYVELKKKWGNDE